MVVFKVLRTSGFIKEIRTNSLSIRKLNHLIYEARYTQNFEYYYLWHVTTSKLNYKIEWLIILKRMA